MSVYVYLVRFTAAAACSVTPDRPIGTTSPRSLAANRPTSDRYP